MIDEIRRLKEQIRVLEEKIKGLEENLAEEARQSGEQKPAEGSGTGSEETEREAETRPTGEGEEGRKPKPSMIVTKTDDGKIIIDVGYMGEILEEVVTGIKGEIERSVMVGAEKVKESAEKIVVRRDIDRVRSSKVFAAAGNEHRLKILEELEGGGMYAGELEEKVGVSASTLSAHLKILVESGLLQQEGPRGRYLLTLLGRRILRWARFLSKA